MNGWWWAALAIAVQIIGAALMSLLLRHGEQQARAARRSPQHTPAWARTDHHRHDHGRHRR
ncbi:hypothetical protein ACIOD1_12830 [Streptomyces sp. NPDC088097]|uniref:hypothetical protein n=1 Tax=Streptomyces sp. NPDC088097 TaxID=3365823 RepID=UPI0038173894